MTNVAIIDDDEGIIERWKSIAKLLGLHVETAESFSGFLTQHKSNPIPDVIFLDWFSDDEISPCSFIVDIKQICPETRIFVLTAWELNEKLIDHKKARSLIERGVIEEWLVKTNVEPERIINIIREGK